MNWKITVALSKGSNEKLVVLIGLIQMVIQQQVQ
ncbi:unnamed protein product [Schistosoma curassoni]|uniref:COMM domain-containing protein n=1 Tax=Schistosoma curassoni TaxID=6186 RepID=A0A183JT06_9TREM|nr:unnamed protein product [Schistosoma curassoni]